MADQERRKTIAPRLRRLAGLLSPGVRLTDEELEGWVEAAEALLTELTACPLADLSVTELAVLALLRGVGLEPRPGCPGCQERTAERDEVTTKAEEGLDQRDEVVARARALIAALPTCERGAEVPWAKPLRALLEALSRLDSKPEAPSC
jgi:hypothetical protein